MMRKYYYFIAGLSIFVVMIIIGSIIQTGGPGSARAVKLDEQRLENFSQIQEAVDEYYYLKRKLPLNLEEAIKYTGFSASITDPETKKPYEYNPLSRNSYNLCTEFSTDTKDVNRSTKNNNYIEAYGYPSNKSHPKGYFCINYYVDDTDNYDDYEDEYYDEYDDEYYEDYYDYGDSEPSASNVQNLKQNIGWFDKNENIQYTLKNAYLSKTLAYDGEDYEYYWGTENKGQLYLVLEIEAENQSSEEIYPETAKIIRLENEGKRIKEDDTYSDYLYKNDILQIYSIFSVDEKESNFKILFGDLQSPQTVNLDFDTATEAYGILDLPYGFEETEKPVTSPSTNTESNLN